MYQSKVNTLIESRPNFTASCTGCDTRCTTFCSSTCGKNCRTGIGVDALLEKNK